MPTFYHLFLIPHIRSMQEGVVFSHVCRSVHRGSQVNKFEQECIPVGCVPPACSAYPSMHCSWEGYLPRGCTCLGDVPVWGCTCWGVYLLRGCICSGGVPAWGCTCQGVYLTRWGCLPAQGGYLPRRGTCPQVLPRMDRQTPVKTTFANFVCGR